MVEKEKTKEEDIEVVINTPNEVNIFIDILLISLQ